MQSTRTIFRKPTFNKINDMINRIKIENFKSIQVMDVELRPINVLIGANGAGKSK